jgi:hypothetical protein
MSTAARDPAERIAAALEAIAHSLAVGVERDRDKRRKAAAPKAKRYPAPPARPVPTDDLTRKRRERAGKTADAALRKLGIT